MEAKVQAIESITQARAELDRALESIDRIEVFDPTLVGLVAHALGNYITVTAATVELLKVRLRDHGDPDVSIWLEGVGHAADLMQHSVSRLVSWSAPSSFPLKLDYVNVPLLVERACEYYRRRNWAGVVRISFQATGSVPLVWADRVALAVIVDNLLANAVRRSTPNGTVEVRIATEPGHVICSVKDSGPGLTADEQDHLFDLPVPGTVTVKAGIGLAIAADFVRRLHGEMWSERERDEGARIAFRLPALE